MERRNSAACAVGVAASATAARSLRCSRRRDPRLQHATPPCTYERCSVLTLCLFALYTTRALLCTPHAQGVLAAVVQHVRAMCSGPRSYMRDFFVQAYAPSSHTRLLRAPSACFYVRVSSSCVSSGHGRTRDSREPGQARVATL
jgi:hypothetical protein